MFSQILSKRSN